MSLKDQIAAYGSNLKVKKLEIDGLKDFYIREMSAGDREQLEDDLESKSIQNKLRATIFIKSVCDKTGTLLYTADELDEVNAYRLPLLTKVFNESNKLNGIALGDVEAVEDEVKN